jgi:SAM-dependent methyltransferase
LTISGPSLFPRILEVGYGSGSFAVSLRRELPKSQYTGIDINSSSLHALEAQGFNVLCQDFELFSSQLREKFDVIVSFQVLEHLSRPSSFFRSIHSLLNESGVLIIAVPSADSFMYYENFNILNMPPHHLTLWSDKCLERYPKAFGLSIQKLDPLPLEYIHQAGFIDALFNLQLTQGPYGSIFRKLPLLKSLALKAILRLGANPVIPASFNIRGHTSMAFYTKCGS